MSEQIHVQQLRGSTTAVDAYTGSDGELVVDKGSHSIRVHDGTKQGGYGTVNAMHYDELPATVPDYLATGAHVTSGEGRLDGGSGADATVVKVGTVTQTGTTGSLTVTKTGYNEYAININFPEYPKKASTDDFGIVKVSDGLAVSDGVLSVAGGVAKPLILSPATGITVPNQGFTIVGSAFVTNGMFDTLASVHYKFYKAGTLVRKYSYLTNQTSHTFTYEELSSLPIDTYDLRIQYTGGVYGDSPESDAVQIRIVNGVISATGRFVYRHESDTGSVIVYDDFGTQRMLLVYDAAYRSGTMRWQSPASAAMPSNRWDHRYYIGNTLNVIDSNTGHESFVSASRDVMVSKAAYMTDSHYQEALRDTYVPIKMTAKAATDLLLNAGASPVATYVRGLDVPHEAQVPTAYQALVMFAEGDHIDDLDPTVASNKTKALGKYPGVDYRWFNNVNAWTSTECTDTNAVRMMSAGYLIPVSKAAYSFHVAPIAELL